MIFVKSLISSVYFVNITLSDSVSDQSERNWPFYDGIKRRRQESLVLLQVRPRKGLAKKKKAGQEKKRKELASNYVLLGMIPRESLMCL